MAEFLKELFQQHLVNGAIIAALVSVTLWYLNRFLDQRKSKKSLIRCLHTEVKHNLADVKVFQQSRESILGNRRRLRWKLEDGVIPLAIFSDHTAIYATNIHHLHYLEDSTIQELLSFYGSLRIIGALSDGFDLPSFKTISIEGQISTIEKIYNECELCIKHGNSVLKELSDLYKKLYKKDLPIIDQNF